MSEAEATFTPRSTKGVAHLYAEKLTAFEHRPSSSSPPAKNFLLFIGGLGDSILTVPFPAAIAAALPPTWNLVEVMISSSGTAFGCGSLKRDADEIAKCVKYFRERNEGCKIVLMGHSTGCQDLMQYLTGDANKKAEKFEDEDGRQERDDASTRPRVQGAILQAPVSDREGIEVTGYDKDIFNQAVKTAEEWTKTRRAEDCLPFALTNQFFGSIPVNAERFLSLALPGGDDDFFSSNLSDEMLAGTFGRIPKGTKLCVLYSGKDEYALPSIKKEELIAKWKGFVEKSEGDFAEGYSGVVEGATHSLREEGQGEAVADCVKRVVGFVEEL